MNTQDSGWMKIVNINSGKLLAVQDSSLANSTDLVQQSDTNGDNQLWRVQDYSQNDQFRIRNKNSGLVAGVMNESMQNTANIVQYADTGTQDHIWELLLSVPPSR